MKLFRTIILSALMLIPAASVQAHDNTTVTAYRVTTLRAMPGAWEELKTLIEAQGEAGVHGDDRRFAPFRLRHSQGDHWDFMLIQAFDDFRIPLPDTPEMKVDLAFKAQIAALVDYSEEWFVSGPHLNKLIQAFDGAGLYHIEMFRAKAGAHDALLKQRQAENAYLRATGQTENEIFVSIAGADWDVMTIGFHDNLKSFAADAPVSDTQKDKAARDAGFDGVGDLAPFLRNLLVGHNDTLAVPMK